MKALFEVVLVLNHGWTRDDLRTVRWLLDPSGAVTAECEGRNPVRFGCAEKREERFAA